MDILILWDNTDIPVYFCDHIWPQTIMCCFISQHLTHWRVCRRDTRLISTGHINYSSPLTAWPRTASMRSCGRFTSATRRRMRKTRDKRKTSQYDRLVKNQAPLHEDGGCLKSSFPAISERVHRWSMKPFLLFLELKNADIKPCPPAETAKYQQFFLWRPGWPLTQISLKHWGFFSTL